MTSLSEQEKRWLLKREVLRATDGKEVQIYPMGAERYLWLVLTGKRKNRYPILDHIVGKDIVIIPGHGNTAFLFAQAGARSISVFDQDPITIAWMKAFKIYYHYRQDNYPSIGELLTALTAWYPPYLKLPAHSFINRINWSIMPNALRRTYIHYILDLVQSALEKDIPANVEFEHNIQFHVGSTGNIFEQQKFDTAFVPYLLGVNNGVESIPDIVEFFQALRQHVPQGHILVNPSRNNKEFYFFGKRYLILNISSIQAIPELNEFFMQEDKAWFRTQGLAIFKTH